MQQDHSHSLPRPIFDRELSLDELLSGIDITRLNNALTTAIGSQHRIVDLAGKALVNTDLSEPITRTPICPEMEPIAYFEAELADPNRIRAAVALLTTILRLATRFQMASDLHLETVQADYTELQQQHDALQESEARYRKLAGHLEQRVETQVTTIQSAQRQLYQAEKMASIGQLAAGVVHYAGLCQNLCHISPGRCQRQFNGSSAKAI
jgi:two-component system, NtrC family, sensor kinase